MISRISMNTDTPRQVQLRQDLQQSRQQHQGKVVPRRQGSGRQAILPFHRNAGSDSRSSGGADRCPRQLPRRCPKSSVRPVSAATISAFCDSLEAKDSAGYSCRPRKPWIPSEARKLKQEQYPLLEGCIVQSRKDFRLAAASDAMGVHAGVSYFRLLSDSDRFRSSFSIWDELRAQLRTC